MSTTMTTRCYSDLNRIADFYERYKYLKIGGVVGESTFGFDRYLNQAFYRSREWLKARNEVIARDNGFDLGYSGFPIGKGIIVHHMNPITLEQIEERDPAIFDPEFLICVSPKTHNSIHFGDETLLPQLPIFRKPGDTCPWK